MHLLHLDRDGRKGVGALQAGKLARLFAFGREIERVFKAVRDAEHRAPRLLRIVKHIDLVRPRGVPKLVGEIQPEAVGVEVAALVQHIGRRGVGAKARHIHGEDLGLGLALDHPLRQRQTDAAALRKARHDAAGRPVVRHARHGPDQGIAVRGEGEGAIDDAADARLGH